MTHLKVRNPIKQERTDYVLKEEEKYALLFFFENPKITLMISKKTGNLQIYAEKWKVMLEYHLNISNNYSLKHSSMAYKHILGQPVSYFILSIDKLFSESLIESIEMIDQNKKYLLLKTSEK